MKHNAIKNKLWLFLCIVLIAASAFTMTACSKEEQSSNDGTEWLEGGTLGEGENSFSFTVTDGEGKVAEFTICYTDAESVGEALLAVDLIAGEDGPYGLYVKTVNGVTADYDANGTYWSFYVDGTYASTGVDVTPITEGSSYAFKVEK